jgi:hypothetical protein
MAQTGYTPLLIYASGTASNVPSAANLTSSASGAELALNYADGKLYFKNSSGVVTLLASAAGASGDVVGPASATDNALARFDTTTGKLIQNSVGILSDAGALSGLTDITASGNVTLSGGTANGVAYLNGSKVLTTGSALTFDGTNLGVGTSSPSSFSGYTTVSVNNATNGGIYNILVNGTETARLQAYSGIFNVAAKGAATNLTFETNGAERMRLDSSGNLGLGVTPSAWGSSLRALQIGYVYGGALSTNPAGNTTTHLTHNAWFDGTNWKYGASSIGATRYTMDGPNAGSTHSWSIAAGGTAGNTITFTQAMTLDASGNLLVGTTSALTSASGRGNVTINGTDAVLAFGNSNSSAGYVYAASTNLEISAASTRYINFLTNGSERARITSGGNLLVGTTSFSFSSNGVQIGADGRVWNTSNIDYNFELAGSTGNRIRFYTSAGGSGATVGSITVSTTATAYNTSSDYRLKDNAQPLTGSGAFIDALQPKTWDWKDGGGKGVGFIAHEVQEISPGSVVGAKDAVDAEGNPVMQAMEYGSAEFIANIVAELQSLRARVAQLESKGA